MPLSDKEQEILEQIEQQLVADDPKFGRRVSTTLDGRQGRILKLGIALFVVGFLSLVGYLAIKMLLLGVGAFLLMLAGAIMGLDAARKAGLDRRRNAGEGTSLKRLFGPLEERMRGFRRDGDK